MHTKFLNSVGRARRSPEGEVELQRRRPVQIAGGRSQMASRLRHKSST